MTDDSAELTPRPPMRLRRVAIILIMVLVAPALAWVIWDRVEAMRLSRQLDALFPLVDADDEARAAARDAERTPEQAEAARLYAEAARQMRPSPTDPSNVRLQEAGQAIEALSMLTPAQVLHDPRVQDLQRIEEPYGPGLELLDRATPLDALPDTADAERNRDTMSYRRVANVNALRTARRSFAGDGAGAGAALLGTLRLNRMLTGWFFARVPIRTTSTLGVVLTFGAPSDAVLQTLQREYDTRQPEHGVEDALIDARYQLVRNLAPSEFGTTSTWRPTGPVQAIVYRLGRPVRDRWLIAELGHYEEAVDAARKPWPDSLDAARALEQKYGVTRPQGSRRRSLLENMFAPWGGIAINDVAALTPSVAETLARARVAIAAIAVERYRRAHQGALPSTLTELTPAFVPVQPLDPFSGRELCYRRTATEYRIYSVGANRKDDGGEWDRMSDLNPYRRGDPKDVGIAVGLRPSP